MQFSPTRLRAIRRERGLSLQSLAERSGHSYDTLIRAELGKSDPRANTLADFANALGVDIFDLFESIPAGGAR